MRQRQCTDPELAAPLVNQLIHPWMICLPQQLSAFVYVSVSGVWTRAPLSILDKLLSGVSPVACSRHAAPVELPAGRIRPEHGRNPPIPTTFLLSS